MFRDNPAINVKVPLPWRKAASIVEGDARYLAIPEKEREGLYEEFNNEKEKSSREAARVTRKENMKKFRNKLESDTTINVASQWRKVKETYKDIEAFKVLDKLDRLAVFEEFIRDLEREDEDKKRLDQYQKKRQSRQNRDAFRVIYSNCFI
jgi:pre-mRNA-processing factor 40